MDKKFDEDSQEDSDDNIYSEETVEDLEENDEINPDEGAFMEGYMKEQKSKKKKKKRK